MENKSAFQLSRCWELFSPSLSQTLTKLHDAVSALTRFLEFKPAHMFGCILDRQACTPTFATFQTILTPFKPNLVETVRRSFPYNLNLMINLDANLINKRACKLLTHSKIFSPTLRPTLEKPHNGVSRLTNFSKLKFNHRFIDPFGR